MRREDAAEARLDERGGLRRIDDPLWRFHCARAVPGRLGAPQPSPWEGCDGMIADMGGDFRVAGIIVEVKMKL